MINRFGHLRAESWLGLDDIVDLNDDKIVFATIGVELHVGGGICATKITQPQDSDTAPRYEREPQSVRSRSSGSDFLGVSHSPRPVL